MKKQLAETISERSILEVPIANFRPLRNHVNSPISLFFVVEQNYSAVFTYHSPFSTIITVSPALAVRVAGVDGVLSVSMTGFLLSSSDVELLRVFDAVVGLASVIFPGSLQSKRLFEQSVERLKN